PGPWGLKICAFFFSSRRRHTRFSRDWSSDVCSSDLLGALVTGGAVAAFLSTSSGITVSVAGVIAQDILRGGVRSFRAGTLLALVVPLALAIAARSLPIADVVGLAFAVAASTFCPLLVLGVWWR